MASRPPVIGRRYQLLRKIGTGGMGAVWLAVDEVLGREVAVKRVGMFPGGTSPDLLRAQREAKLAASLNHPHVVSVFDFVTEGEEQWLVMEYVEGTNLSVLATERGGLPPAEAATITGQVAEALAAAHSAGIVHRDVKPSNVLVTDAGTAKLADFGIARARADSTLTDSGVVTGTPSYLAPEVASGATATEASDVWSLGATLFHTLTGRPPYDVSDNVLAAMYRIVHEDPPRLGDTAWPAALLEHTMATDPEDRWPMVRVREYLLAPPHTAPAPPPRSVETAAAVPATVAEPPTLSLRIGTAAGPPEIAADEPVVENAAARPSEPPPPPLGTTPARAGTSGTPRSEGRPRVGRKGLVLLLVLLVAAAAGWALLRGGAAPTSAHGPSASPGTRNAGPSHSPSPNRSSGASPTASTTRSSGSSSAGSSGGAAEAMRTFVRDYIATAPSDPATAWRELTPRFQQHVGSYGNYAGYWDTIRTATLRDIRADPTTMVVSYVITWYPKGRAKEDQTVVLDLVKQDGRYLIDRER